MPVILLRFDWLHSSPKAKAISGNSKHRRYCCKKAVPAFLRDCISCFPGATLFYLFSALGFPPSVLAWYFACEAPTVSPVAF